MGMRLLIIGFITMAGVVSAEEAFKPRQVVGAFPAIKEPKSVDVAAARTLVRDEELVLGVVVGGQARAYPINMLTNPKREIINDRLGGRSIAATW